MIKCAFYGGIIGVCIGDAVGLPVRVGRDTQAAVVVDGGDGVIDAERGRGAEHPLFLTEPFARSGHHPLMPKKAAVIFDIRFVRCEALIPRRQIG